MTLGEKLSQYRRTSGMTQQELGEHLNISAQAISKWENDLSEPDISTLKRLSELFNVSMVELLDIEEKKEEKQEEQSVVTKEDVDNIATEIKGVVEEMNSTKALGFCTSCGITVTEENLGEVNPKVICSKCLENKKEAQRKEIREEKARAEAAKRHEDHNRSRMRFKRNASIITGICIGLAALIASIICFDNKGTGVVAGIVLGYMSFAFTAQMFFDGVVRNIFLDMAEKSIHFPGLIFTFDIDGILWLISMKILFGILGFLGAILFALLGFVIAFVCAPFVYPFSLGSQNKAIRECDLAEFDMN